MTLSICLYHFLYGGKYIVLPSYDTLIPIKCSKTSENGYDFIGEAKTKKGSTHRRQAEDDLPHQREVFRG